MIYLTYGLASLEYRQNKALKSALPHPRLARFGLGGYAMPLVQVYLWPGRDAKVKKNIIKGITKVFEDNGIPSQAVEVIIQEVPKENWGLGGIPASEKFP